MSVHRVMGIETEFGISVPGDPLANPVLLSGRIVSTYAAAHGIRPRRAAWDYDGEDPLADARGYLLQRYLADPSQLTDDPTTTNVVIPNGARFYVDHAHPEYSAPETTTPRDAMVWDRAGELVALEAMRLVAQAPGGPPILLYRNNTDGKGASYGTHENYLMDRAVPFGRIVEDLTPFFVARQVLCGAGRVGLGQDSRRPGYQIGARSDFFETEVGLETTLRRPLINTRDEPHADPERYRRLHVILGDANQCDVPNLLKLGTTALVLGLIEDGGMARTPRLADPVRALHAISHDPTLRTTVSLFDGREVTALDLLWMYHDAVARWLAESRREDLVPEQTQEVMALFADLLTRLGADPMDCATDVEWVAKLRLLRAYRERDRLGWDHARLAAIDIQWADIRPEKGLARQLELRGQVRRLTDPAELRRAAASPPPDTRAWFRGECVRRYGDAVAAASWDSVIFDVPGESTYRRVPTLDPYAGTQAQVGTLLDACEDAAELLRRIEAEPG